MIKTILFDFDGTLFDTGEGILRSVQYALEGFGIHETDTARLRKFVGPPLLDSFSELYAMTPEQAQAAVARYRERYLPVGIYECTLYPGIPELLSYLQDAGIQIAVASNKYQAATQKLIDHYFPEIHFTAVFGQREGIKVKPDPTVVFDILEVAKVTKEEVLYVGDSGVDMQTAANARVTVCGVTWGFRPRAELEEFSPQYIVDTAEEIKRLIL